MGPVHPYSNEGHVSTRFGYAAAALAEGLRDRPFDVVEGFNYVTYPAAAVARPAAAPPARRHLPRELVAR